MKILIVHPQMSLYGGAEVVIVRLANYLQNHGHYVSILTLCVKDRVEYSGLTFILPDKTKDRIEYRLRGSLDTLAEVYHMYQALKKLCAMHVDVFDVINVHNFPAIWSVPQDKKVIWMCNEIPDLYHNHHISKFINPLLNIGRYGDRLITRTKHAVAVVDQMPRVGRKPFLLGDFRMHAEHAEQHEQADAAEHQISEFFHRFDLSPSDTLKDRDP